MILCKECNSKAIIQKTERLTPEYNRLYCTCKNFECGHRFVLELTYSHSLKPSKLKEKNAFAHLVAYLSQEEKQNIYKLLNQDQINLV